MQSRERAMEVLDYVEAECKLADPRFANTLVLAHLLAHAERQTTLLEQIAAALHARAGDGK